MVANDQPALIRRSCFRRAILLGLLLVVIDALLLNQGTIALAVGLWMLFVGLPRTFLAKKLAPVRAQRVANIAIYLAAVILVFGLNAANNQLARGRAQTLITAIRAFQADNGRFPNSLWELVPEYAETIPLAKYTLMFNQYR